MGELLSKESEDRVPNKSDDQRGLTITQNKGVAGSIFARFSAWLGKQSLTRLLGLLVGNTRDLELRLIDKDKEIDWLRSQLIDSQKQLISFQDSVLLSKGMIATQSSASKNNGNGHQTVTYAPGERLAIEDEIDRLRDMLIYKPGEVEEALDDLLATNTPRNKEIVRRFTEWVDAIPDVDDGVVIQG